MSGTGIAALAVVAAVAVVLAVWFLIREHYEREERERDALERDDT